MPTPAFAHSFGMTYKLPVPIWMYLYGATAALLASFVVLAYFISEKPKEQNAKKKTSAPIILRESRTLHSFINILRLLSVSCLLLAIIAGFVGTNNEYKNINMTLFWVIFVLGFTYLTAVIGDLFSVVNPWKVMADWLERPFPNLFAGKCHYPNYAQYWPALLLYMVFIWLELFAGTKPLTLSFSLLIYTGLNLLGCAVIGKQKWFKYCEFFSVFLRITAKIAPVEFAEVYSQKPSGHTTLRNQPAKEVLRLRMPFSGLLTTRIDHISLLIFVLFMLSSTAFDGIKNTLPWVEIYWVDLYQAVLKPIFGSKFHQTYPLLVKIYLGYQTVILFLSPFLYLGIYLLFIWTAKIITRSELPVRQLSLSFGLSLVPIVFVYHLTHYYTLILTQGVQMGWLVSDPFGLGWNLLDTVGLRSTVVPNMGFVWHTQVLLIVLGHIASVYLAHIQALRIFKNQRQAVFSQLPMLVLMMLFTAIGLWILALPVQSGAPTGI